MASIFSILNRACLIFAVGGNVLEKCCLLQKQYTWMFLNFTFTICMNHVSDSHHIIDVAISHNDDVGANRSARERSVERFE